MERHFRKKPGQAHVAKRATLQHLFGNRALFPVEPNRHNDGKGNSNSIDLYALYANTYKLDAEEESAASVPFYREEKEMPMMLQITRWFEHVWPYLREGDDEEDRTDEDDSSSDDGDVGMDEGILGTGKRIRSQKAGLSLPSQARKRRKMKHNSQATLLLDVEMGNLGELDNDIDSDHDSDANEDDDSDEDEDEMDVDEVDDDGCLLDEEFVETRRRSQIGKRARRRWEKWDTSTSIHKSEILVSVVTPISTKEQRMRWYGTKLRDAIHYWMEHVAKNVQKSGLRIRQVLGG